MGSVEYTPRLKQSSQGVIWGEFTICNILFRNRACSVFPWKQPFLDAFPVVCNPCRNNNGIFHDLKRDGADKKWGNINFFHSKNQDFFQGEAENLEVFEDLVVNWPVWTLKTKYWRILRNWFIGRDYICVWEDIQSQNTVNRRLFKAIERLKDGWQLTTINTTTTVQPQLIFGLVLLKWLRIL